MKIRSQNNGKVPAEKPQVYLPLRRVVAADKAHFERLDLRVTERSPGIVPFYTCGDQQESCEAYNQPVSTRSSHLFS